MKVGDIVEDFELPDEQGVPRRLSGLLADGPVVLFFYPAAFTAGCTAEACHFRDVAAELRAVGAQPVGISGDKVDRQAEFSTRYSLGYPLLADTDGTVRRQFGVGQGFSITNRRVTFVIDTDRRILEIVRSQIRMNAHADQALEAIRARRSPGIDG